MLQNYANRRDERDAELARVRRDRALLRQRLEDTEWSLCQRAGEIALLKNQLKDAQVSLQINLLRISPVSNFDTKVLCETAV